MASRRVAGFFFFFFFWRWKWFLIHRHRDAKSSSCTNSTRSLSNPWMIVRVFVYLFVWSQFLFKHPNKSYRMQFSLLSATSDAHERTSWWSSINRRQLLFGLASLSKAMPVQLVIVFAGLLSYFILFLLVPIRKLNPVCRRSHAELSSRITPCIS